MYINLHIEMPNIYICVQIDVFSMPLGEDHRLSRLHKGKALMSILQEEGFRVSLSGVHYTLKKYKETGSYFDRPRCGRPKITPEQALQSLSTVGS